MTKMSRQKFKYLRTKIDFELKYKASFITFKRLSVTENCLRSESVPLSTKQYVSKASQSRRSHLATNCDAFETCQIDQSQ